MQLEENASVVGDHCAPNVPSEISGLGNKLSATRLLAENLEAYRKVSGTTEPRTFPAGENLPKLETSTAAHLHLTHLDGIRGLAALYIVIYHYAAAICPTPASGSLLYIRHVIDRSGPAGVAVFIVLSGYCLMLPVARAGSGALPGGFWPYIKRRAWRILPPYYAALTLTILLIVLVPAFGTVQHDWWDHALPALQWDNIVAHVLLLHTFSGSRWATHINGPFWSVAVEWHLYFAFPLLMLPLLRRLGVAAMVLISTAIGLAIYAVWPRQWEHTWYLGLFAAGAAAASIGFTDDRCLCMLRLRIPWGWISFVSWIATIALTLNGANQQRPVGDDIVIGLAAASLLIYCTRHVTYGMPKSQSMLLRMFCSRAAVSLGVISYSLYLTHAPVVAAVDKILHHTDFSPAFRAVVMFGPGTLAAVVVAWLFYLGFERPFRNHRGVQLVAKRSQLMEVFSRDAAVLHA